ncbi:MAG TPA: MoxR family ATPase [Candidatus Woesearchaeota archaeon]|nr:MoxR family ATPase [Candidatus Woesearchaeota archaeon]
MDSTLPTEEAKKIKEQVDETKKEIKKIFIGQDDTVNSFLTCLFSNGSVLIEGVPGLGKTLLARAIAAVLGCKFSRIQFTPDLLPTDIIGVTTYEKERGFYVLKGPVFSNIVLADEINRAPPKVQSALLESMQEKQATIGKETFPLPVPFFVLATENPLESLGTYPLPEAQLDRFLFKIFISYPSFDEELMVLDTNITSKKFDEYSINPILSSSAILNIQSKVSQVYTDEKVKHYIVKIVDATRHPDNYKLKTGKYISYGSSPRASIATYISSKVDALLLGKNFVTPFNVKRVVRHILNHRIGINFEGESEGVKPFDVIDEIMSKIPVP